MIVMILMKILQISLVLETIAWIEDYVNNSGLNSIQRSEEETQTCYATGQISNQRDKTLTN